MLIKERRKDLLDSDKYFYPKMNNNNLFMSKNKFHLNLRNLAIRNLYLLIVN